jgi:hypothetical protein
MPPLQHLRIRVQQSYHSVRNLTQREKQRLVDEMQKTRGLMPILMKQRNGHRWTAEDKALLRDHVRRLSQLSPYLVLIVMPGGFFVLPVFAWWVDRRRRSNRLATPLKKQ